jgi:hypothetical protein
VESWDEYRRLYGSFEGAGLLPYAVASFFEQGGRRAYVVRIVHDYGDRARDGAGVASAVLEGITVSGGGAVRLRARSEGVWGNALRATLSFRVRPVLFTSATNVELAILSDAPLPAGSLLRLTLPGGGRALRFASQVREVFHLDAPSRERRVTLDQPVSVPPIAAESVEGVLEVEDPHPALTRIERHDRLGFSPLHPRWIAGVLSTDSALLWPDAAWADADLVPAGASLASASTRSFDGGTDRSGDIVPEDFFDPDWVPGDERPGAGVHSLVDVPDLSTLVVPDLYSPGGLPEQDWIADPVTLAGPAFALCIDVPAPAEQGAAVPELVGLRLDPTLPGDLRRIVERQQQLVDVAELVQGFVVLLDVPPGLNQRQLLRWRDSFDSSYAAAYHPWLAVARIDDRGSVLRRIGPSAVAAGIIARRERLFGVPYGPANEIATGVIDVTDRVAAAWHDELHQNGINVYLHERDGIRLTAGRTLARDPSYRQLSVRRLVTMLRRVLQQQMQWMAFEPNADSLRASVRHMLRGFLGQLFEAGALAGATEDEAFFVRCDDALNPASVVDAGRLIVEVGIAPAEPLEFLVLRFTRDGDGTLWVEGRRA